MSIAKKIGTCHKSAGGFVCMSCDFQLPEYEAYSGADSEIMLIRRAETGKVENVSTDGMWIRNRR